jgi:hypothetical protein
VITFNSFGCTSLELYPTKLRCLINKQTFFYQNILFHQDSFLKVDSNGCSISGGQIRCYFWQSDIRSGSGRELLHSLASDIMSLDFKRYSLIQIARVQQNGHQLIQSILFQINRINTTCRFVLFKPLCYVQVVFFICYLILYE